MKRVPCVVAVDGACCSWQDGVEGFDVRESEALVAYVVFVPFLLVE